MLILSNCIFINRKDVPDLTIQEKLDTIWVKQERQHGYYLINDSLTIYAGWPLLDSSICKTLEHRNKPIWSPSEKPYQCSISDLHPPFQVFKRANSDTIYVIKNGKVLRFRMKLESY